MNKRILIFIIIFTFVLGCTCISVNAQCTAKASGAWASASTWTGGVPTSTETATIGNGFTVTIGASGAVCSTLTISSGGTLNLGTGSLAPALTVSNGGGITVNTGGVLKEGNATTTDGITIGTTTGTGCAFVNNGTVDIEGDMTVNATTVFSGTGSFTLGRLVVNQNNITLTINNTISYSSVHQNACTVTNTGITFAGTGTFDLTPNTASGSFNDFATGMTIDCTINSGRDFVVQGNPNALIINGTVTTESGRYIRVGPSADGGNTTITVNSGGSLTSSSDLRLDETSAGWAKNFTLTNYGTVNIGGIMNLYDATGAVFSNYATFITGGGDAHTSGTGAFTNYTSSSLYFDGAAFSIISLTASANYNTVYYASSSAQAITKAVAAKYYNIVVDGGSTATFGANETIEANVTIASGSTLAGSSFTVTVDSNWTNNGTFTGGTSTVVFAGTLAQSIGGSSSTTFRNLTINNTSAMTAGVTQNINTDVSAIMTLTAGAYNLSGYTLELTNQSYLNMVGGSSTAYIVSEDTVDMKAAGVVNSLLRWDNIATSAQKFVFPFGCTISGTNYYLPFIFQVTSTSGAAGTYVAVGTYHTSGSLSPYADLSPSVSNMNGAGGNIAGCDPGANGAKVAVNRFWQINHTGVPPTATVTFTYAGAENNTTTACGGGSTGTLAAQEYKTAGWITGVGTGASVTTGTGSVVVTGQSSFSPWVLSSSTQPLPVQLTSFTVECVNNSALLQWSTATETNNNYFTIERTQDGVNYQAVGTVKGAGNSEQPLFYSFTDNSPLTGISYYRLSQTDDDGTITNLNNIVYVPCENDATIDAYAYKNNSVKMQVNATADDSYNLTLTDALGRAVVSKTYTVVMGLNIFTLPVNLSSGIYILRLQGSSSVFTKKLILGH